MASAESHVSFVPFSSIGRSIFGHRRDQIHAVDGHGDETKLDSFHRRVADHFLALSPTAAGSGDGDGERSLLSISWIRPLLDSFLVCQQEFRIVLFNHKDLLAKPSLDRLMAEYSDRAIKALDVCNAVRNGIDRVRQWRRQLDIVLAALNHRSLGEGQLRRASKALKELAFLMYDDGSVLAQFNRSFGGRGDRPSKARPQFRSLSWTISRSWSAARQIQAVGNNLTAPRAAEIASTCGLASPVFAMSSVLLFMMWALVAAIPCQDRGLQSHFSPPRAFPWAGPMQSLHDQIVEESKKKERKNSAGLLKEIHQIEKGTRRLMELIDTTQFPLVEAREVEVRKVVKELAMVSESLEDGLGLLERQIREVFHQIVRNRIEGLDSLS